MKRQVRRNAFEAVGNLFSGALAVIGFPFLADPKRDAMADTGAGKAGQGLQFGAQSRLLADGIA